jgi:hypothetical protein
VKQRKVVGNESFPDVTALSCQRAVKSKIADVADMPFGFQRVGQIHAAFEAIQCPVLHFK